MKAERYLLIAYDIKDNPTRTHLARRLTYYGLKRIQYSVFEGCISLHDKNRILDEIEECGLGSSDKVRVIDLCENCMKNLIVFGNLPETPQHLII